MSSAQAFSIKHNSSLLRVDKKAPLKAFDDRSTNVRIVNWLNSPVSDIVYVNEGIYDGEWKSFPPSTISFDSYGDMGTTSDAWLHGAGGWVQYKVRNDGAVLTFRWMNPYAGTNSYFASADPDDYYFTQEGGDGDNASVTWYVRKKDLPAPLENYSAVIMADPQPWRLGSGGDPNSDDENGDKWRGVDRNTFNSIISHENLRFSIVNGDLSEYGRSTEYDDYFYIYHSSQLFITEGLGNHDYANNVGDCVDFWAQGPSKDGCALSAVVREYNVIQNIKSNIGQIPGSSFSSDAYLSANMVGDTFVQEFGGSFAYSWDVGDIHYVQLQNYPTYKVSLTAGGEYSLTSAELGQSLDWLEGDLEKSDLRGKLTILNFHDARPAAEDGESHFLDRNNMTELSKFKSIITSHHVAAIFVGHTHQQSYCRAQDDAVFGNIPVYTAGALFKGDYYLIDVSGKKINVRAYNGSTGSPVLVNDLGIIGSDTYNSSTCSNL